MKLLFLSFFPLFFLMSCSADSSKLPTAGVSTGAPQAPSVSSPQF